MERPAACWEGQDRYRDKVLPSLTIILKTSGCRHDRCRMCSYRHERYPGGEDLVIDQLRWVQEHHDLPKMAIVKLYTSGSFFDPCEVPAGAARYAAEIFAGKLVIAETRPEYVETGRLEEFISRIDTGVFKTPLTVAIGLETVTDTIREKSIDKGFSWDEFLQATKKARTAGAGVKAYLLQKPLFLTEAEANDDMEKSIRALEGIADAVSMNPCTVQKNTELEYYWQRGAYRPPYLWSVLSVLLSSPYPVTCDPVGGGRSRGPHNCGKCDREVVDAIRSYSLTANRSPLSAVFEKECTCREEWEFVLAHERPYSLPLTR